MDKPKKIIIDLASEEERKIYSAQDFRSYIDNRISYGNYNEIVSSPLLDLSQYCRPGEIFYPFIDNPNYYVSNFGMIYSCFYNRFLTLHLNRCGYLYTHIYYGINKSRNVKVHRMVMQTFCYRPDYRELQVNHINGNKEQNVYCPGHPLHNLEWCSCHDNILHAVNIGLRNDAGENNNRALHSDAEIHKICQLLEQNPTLKSNQSAQLLGVEWDSKFKQLITEIRTKSTWNNISSNYNITSLSHRLSPDLVREIKKLHNEGESVKNIIIKIGWEYNVNSCSRIYNILNGKHYADIM